MRSTFLIIGLDTMQFQIQNWNTCGGCIPISKQRVEVNRQVLLLSFMIRHDLVFALPKHAAVIRWLWDLDEFDVEDQSWIGWDAAGHTSRPITHVGRDGQLGPFTDWHLGQPIVPSGNNLWMQNSSQWYKWYLITKRVLTGLWTHFRYSPYK